MTTLYTKGAASTEYDKLIYDITIDRRVKGVSLASGQGVLAKGTVLGIVTLTGVAKVVDSTKEDGTETADCVLTDAVDTGTTDPVPAEAYSSGSFNRQALIFGGTDTADLHETILRGKGIFLSDKIPYPQV